MQGAPPNDQRFARRDSIIIVCTENYKAKADGRIGGVGYESNIISGDLYATSGLSEEKYIPVLRSGSWSASLPSYMAGKFGVDCTDGLIDAKSMLDLLVTFGLNALDDRTESPDLQRETPTNDTNDSHSSGTIAPDDNKIKITGIVLDEVTQPKMDGTRGSALYRVPFRLNKRPSPEWRQFFLRAWSFPPRFSTMHRPDIASVVDDVIVLDGTTIDEVADHHRDTLLLCVEQANQEYQKLCEQRMMDERVRRERKEWHQNHVADVAQKIHF